jgi:CheY-like chemotaxis protein
MAEFMAQESRKCLAGGVTPVIVGPLACKLHAIAVLWNDVVATDPSKRSADILVIDDDAILRDLVTDWLEAAGYRVRSAGNCCAGVAELDRAAPALIVSDMFMPGPCGAEVIRQLKREHPDVALIAVSGHFNSGQGISADAAIAAGADRALAKPVKRADLLRAVAELVGAPVR